MAISKLDTYKKPNRLQINLLVLLYNAVFCRFFQLLATV